MMKLANPWKVTIYSYRRRLVRTAPDRRTAERIADAVVGSDHVVSVYVSAVKS